MQVSDVVGAGQHGDPVSHRDVGFPGTLEKSFDGGRTSNSIVQVDKDGDSERTERC